MPSLETLLLFMAATLVLNLTPGPSILYVMSQSISQGRTAGLVSALGLGTGSFLHAVAATLGLSAIMAYSPFVYAVVKYLGAAYLVYLGVGLLLQRESLHVGHQPKQNALSQIYCRGVVTELLNPKVALFFLSFLPQFVDPNQGSIASQTMLLSVVFHLTGVPINMLVAVAGGALAAWFARHPLFEQIRNRLAGTILIGLGLRLAFSERR